MWNQSVEIFGLGFELTLIQVVIVVAFIGLVAGYLLATLVNRRRRPDDPEETRAIQDKERATSNVAFMKGLNYILSEKPDLAIEELTRAVSVDTGTVETYVALGNLFRRKGEIDRAIRIRQSIILRPGIDPKVKTQAEYDLGLDYRKGGFFERAVSTFNQVLAKTPSHKEAHGQLINIYEEIGDWEKAFSQQEKLARLTGARPNHILAHYQVEIGKGYFDKGMTGQAKSAYKKALALDPRCVDAYLHLGDLHFRARKYRKALATWRKLFDIAPTMFYLTFTRLALLASQMKDQTMAERFLAEGAAARPDPLAHLALARLLAQRGENNRAIEELVKTLDLAPSLIEARKEMGLLLLSLGRHEEALDAFRDLLGHLSIPSPTFQCSHCGFETQNLMWRCPQCAQWDSMVLRRSSPLLFEKAGPLTMDLVVVDSTKEVTASSGA